MGFSCMISPQALLFLMLDSLKYAGLSLLAFRGVVWFRSFLLPGRSCRHAACAVFSWLPGGGIDASVVALISGAGFLGGKTFWLLPYFWAFFSLFWILVGVLSLVESGFGNTAWLCGEFVFCGGLISWLSRFPVSEGRFAAAWRLPDWGVSALTPVLEKIHCLDNGVCFGVIVFVLGNGFESSLLAWAYSRLEL
jgi:hypothetical protein